MSIASQNPFVASSALAVALVLAPAAEEVVFRGGLQEQLIRRLRGRIAAADGIAIATTAIAFAGAHVIARSSSAAWLVVAPALVIGLAYGRWRRLDVCIALHACFNALWLTAAGFAS